MAVSSDKNTASIFRSGFVAIMGKPNVGKSTLLNTITGQKIAIVTSRPQTTRNRIMGVKNVPNGQIVLFDTPGIHAPLHTLGRFILKTSMDTVSEVELIYLVVNPASPDEDDISVINMLKDVKKVLFLVVNKIDMLRDKSALLCVIDAYRKFLNFEEIIPVSAKSGSGVDVLISESLRYLPEGPRYYPDEVVTDVFERFMASETIREKLMDYTHDEIPHSIAVDVVRWQEKKSGLISISANILVEKPTQKGIIIGKNGRTLKAAGTKARKEIEDIVGARVYLDLFIKVKKNWRKDVSALKDLGFK
ncbi:GTPase Era [Candidatus Magnetominusculus dajiuhuensis]|uniref:GTPase Era n=1 Tax=Candidatus Magnetominusculus dajiuhuensis TaxID=3137712 RepID=UPI003B43AE13